QRQLSEMRMRAKNSDAVKDLFLSGNSAFSESIRSETNPSPFSPFPVATGAKVTKGQEVAARVVVIRGRHRVFANEQSRSRTGQNLYEKDVCHTSRGVALAVCGGQRDGSGAAPRGTPPLDRETCKDSRSGDEGYLIERGADNGKNAPSRNESRSPRVE